MKKRASIILVYINALCLRVVTTLMNNNNGVQSLQRCQPSFLIGMIILFYIIFLIPLKKTNAYIFMRLSTLIRLRKESFKTLKFSFTVLQEAVSRRWHIEWLFVIRIEVISNDLNLRIKRTAEDNKHILSIFWSLAECFESRFYVDNC